MNTSLTKHRGFTLPELMVATFIAGMLIATMVTAYTQQRKVYQAQQFIAEMQQNVRSGLDIMTRDARTCGYGINVPETQLPLWIDWVPGLNSNPYVIDGGGTNPDEIFFIGAFGEPEASLDSGTTNGAITLALNTGEAAAFNTTDRKVIFIGHTETARILSIAGDTLTVSTHPTSPGAGLTRAHPAGSPVELVKVINYQQTENPAVYPFEPHLIRVDSSISYSFDWQKMAAGQVENLQVTPLPQAVVITLTGKTSKPDPHYTHPIAGDNFRRYSLTSQVASRNTQRL